MKKGLKHFILLSLLAASPVFIVLALYLVQDPFRVVKPYNGYAYTPGDTVTLAVNLGYISTESHRYYIDKQDFNSYIMGSSLANYYRIQDWLPYLPANAHAVHYNAARESLQGLLNKLKYLSRHGYALEHVLLIIENQMFSRWPIDQDILYVQHPDVAPNVGWWQFHQLYFNAFKKTDYILYSLAPNMMTQRMLDKQYATTDIPDRIEPLNESYYAWADSLIMHNPDGYYTPDHLSRYHTPIPMMPAPNLIDSYSRGLLQQIAQLLQQDSVDYHIIIPPVYHQPPISNNDLQELYDLFIKNRVHDYSHDAQMMSSLRYYYDGGHLAAPYCATLIDSAYHEAQLSQALQFNNH